MLVVVIATKVLIISGSFMTCLIVGVDPVPGAGADGVENVDINANSISIIPIDRIDSSI